MLDEVRHYLAINRGSTLFQMRGDLTLSSSTLLVALRTLIDLKEATSFREGGRGRRIRVRYELTKRGLRTLSEDTWIGDVMLEIAGLYNDLIPLFRFYRVFYENGAWIPTFEPVFKTLRESYGAEDAELLSFFLVETISMFGKDNLKLDWKAERAIRRHLAFAEGVFFGKYRNQPWRLIRALNGNRELKRIALVEAKEAERVTKKTSAALQEFRTALLEAK